MKSRAGLAQLLVIGAGLALVACAQRQPQPAPSGTAQAQEAAAPATISAAGYGGVLVGMTPAEAAAAFAQPLAPANPGDEAEECYYLVTPEGFDAPVVFMVTDGTVARADVSAPGVATAAGAQIGDSEADVLALYPGATVTPHHYGDEGDHYIEVTEGAGALVLETWDGRVNYIRAGRLPEAQYIEGCS